MEQGHHVVVKARASLPPPTRAFASYPCARGRAGPGQRGESGYIVAEIAGRIRSLTECYCGHNRERQQVLESMRPIRVYGGAAAQVPLYLHYHRRVIKSPFGVICRGNNKGYSLLKRWRSVCGLLEY